MSFSRVPTHHQKFSYVNISPDIVKRNRYYGSTIFFLVKIFSFLFKISLTRKEVLNCLVGFTFFTKFIFYGHHYYISFKVISGYLLFITLCFCPIRSTLWVHILLYRLVASCLLFTKLCACINVQGTQVHMYICICMY